MKNKTLKNNIKKTKLSSEVIVTHKAIRSLSKNQLKALRTSLHFAVSLFKVLKKIIAEDSRVNEPFSYQIVPFNVKELADLEHQVYSDTSVFNAIDKIRLLTTMVSSEAMHDNAFLSRCKAILNLTNKVYEHAHEAEANVYDYIKDNPIDREKSDKSEEEFVTDKISNKKKKEFSTQEEADEYVKHLLAQFIQESEKSNTTLTNESIAKSGFVDNASVFFKKKKKQKATKPVNLHTYFPSEFSLEYIKTHPIKYSLVDAKIKRVSSNGAPLRIKFSLES